MTVNRVKNVYFDPEFLYISVSVKGKARMIYDTVIILLFAFEMGGVGSFRKFYFGGVECNDIIFRIDGDFANETVPVNDGSILPTRYILRHT